MSLWAWFVFAIANVCLMGSSFYNMQNARILRRNAEDVMALKCELREEVARLRAAVGKDDAA